MIEILRHTSFRRLFLAQVVALVGTGLATVALALLAYDLAGPRAGAVLGTALAIKMTVYVLLAPLAGAFVPQAPSCRRTRIAQISRNLSGAFWPTIFVAMEPRFGSRLIAESEADDIKSLAEANMQFAECVTAAQAGTLAATTAMYAECTDPPRAQLGPDILAERSVLQPRLPYQSAQASEMLHSVYGPDTTPDAHYAGLFDKPHALGDLPLIVLTAGLFDMSPPFGELNYYTWTALHAQTAAMSSRGTERMVPRSRHNIQVEQPQAIVDAVGEVLDMIATPAATAP